MPPLCHRKRSATSIYGSDIVARAVDGHACSQLKAGGNRQVWFIREEVVAFVASSRSCIWSDALHCRDRRHITALKGPSTDHKQGNEATCAVCEEMSTKSRK